MLRAVLATISVLLFASTLCAQDWTRWRGSRSDGVAVVSRAPERWSSDENVVWRAPLEGRGHSSPVIVGSRVYVTTAVREHGRVWLRLALDCLIGLIAVVGVPSLVRYRWALNAPGSGALRALDFAIFALLASALSLAGAFMAVGSAAMNAGLHVVRDVGVALARALGRHHTNLSFLGWDEGTRHIVWIVSTSLGLLSAALIPFLFPARPGTRRLVGLGLCVGVALAESSIPWPTAYGNRHPIGPSVVLYSPVIAIAAWHFLVFAASRSRGIGMGTATPAKSARLVVCIPALLGALWIGSPNVLPLRETLTTRVIAFDTRTGTQLWRADAFRTPPASISALNSHATPTPSVEGDTIVAAFGPGTAAFTLDGRRLWAKTVRTWNQTTIYGAGSSPVTNAQAVFVADTREFDAPRPSTVTAYALSTGEKLWTVEPTSAQDAYASPVLYDDGERTLLVTLSTRRIVAYDAADGRIEWELPIPTSQPVPSPVLADGRLYVSGGKGSLGYTAAYQLRRDAAPLLLWVSRQSAADVSSPVLYKGRFFTISSTGVMVCYDAESGRMIWRRRINAGPGVFYASLVAAEDKLYATRSDGTTYVIAADDSFRIISASSLGEETMASPALAAGCLFLRTASALYCIGRTD